MDWGGHDGQEDRYAPDAPRFLDQNESPWWSCDMPRWVSSTLDAHAASGSADYVRYARASRRKGAVPQRTQRSMTPPPSTFRVAGPDDLDDLQRIREAAFAPVFASFRSILGDEIAAVAQANAEEEQAEHLRSLFDAESGWTVHVAESSDRVVGFVSFRVDADSAVGEIGLNAVHPRSAGNGVGTAMYEFALERMREAGMKVATVSTGADPSHAAARRAYEKAGFSVGIPSIWLCRTLERSGPEASDA